MSAPLFTNRLIREKSPYLLQHAHNPVDWFPWGEEAFQLAKERDKPIFLSIGYSSCHFCHVMERESFEDREIAALMNEAFINIKVDREELPAVDGLYMEFAQGLMSSSGGWPLNVLLTPDLKPFFAVTYLPNENRDGQIGMLEFVRYIDSLWKGEEKEQLIAQATQIVQAFQQAFALPVSEELPTEKTLKTAFEELYDQVDLVYGGFQGEPKFPFGYPALFFLEYARSKGEDRALKAVQVTLEQMKKGGIYDRLGGGFCRYAIDAKWHIPHFEKTLYDNALLVDAYLQSDFPEIARETLEYLIREMRDPEGGFYSAQDADLNDQEGAYYTWTLSEIEQLLGEKAASFCQFYHVTVDGDIDGRSVLYEGDSTGEFLESLAILRKARNNRPPPFKDDKILTGWNGLMIDVLSKAARHFKNPEFLEYALKTAHFLRTHLFKEGKLLRRFREKEARFEAVLDDYAFLIKGLLTLFEEEGGEEWLEWAIVLTKSVEEGFKSERGAFYYHLKDPHLLIRRIEFFDAAEPSGNAVHSENLLRLYQMTGEKRYLEGAEALLKAVKPFIETYPMGSCYHLIALQRYLEIREIKPPREPSPQSSPRLNL